MTNLEEFVTEEYLLEHGFVLYNSREEGDVYNIPFEGYEYSRCYREIKKDRQMFVVIFGAYNGNVNDGCSRHVYVQIDSGCGFIEIPFPWWDLPIEYFESVYYGIRGHTPEYHPKKLTNDRT